MNKKIKAAILTLGLMVGSIASATAETIDITVSGTVVPEPQATTPIASLQISPTSIDFGAGKAGDWTTRTFTITNNGNTPSSPSLTFVSAGGGVDSNDIYDGTSISKLAKLTSKLAILVNEAPISIGKSIPIGEISANGGAKNVTLKVGFNPNVQENLSFAFNFQLNF